MSTGKDSFTGTVEYDPEDRQYRAHYDPNIDPPSMVVVEAMAAIEDRDATTVEPLNGSIDPDALDCLIQSASAKENDLLKVTFTAWGYTITVDSRGTILLRLIDHDDRTDK